MLAVAWEAGTSMKDIQQERLSQWSASESRTSQSHRGHLASLEGMPL
jgi:hypothetical protein